MIRDFESALAERVKQGLPFIQLVLGPRQVGKTTGVKQVCPQWSGEFVFASADSATPHSPLWIEEQWSRAKSLRATKKLLVLDEIQKVAGWSEVVKKLYDEDRHSGLQVVLLGSAGLSLQRDLNESLFGRYEIMRAHHWDLRECQEEFGWDINRYLQFGGYPAAAVLTEDVERWQRFMQDSVLEPVLSRDIFLMREIAKPALFRQTLSLVMQHPAMELSYQKILGQLQDRGNASTIKSYIETLQHAFLVRVLEKYSSRVITSKSSSPKLIPLCPALISAYGDPGRVLSDREWRGRVIEAVVGAKLSHLFPEHLFYWRDGAREVDFVVESPSNLFAIEVKSGRRKDERGIAAFKERFPNARTLIVSEGVLEGILRLRTTTDALLFLKEVSNP